jgi:16S rRNA (guanine966-N2)-methyltransferase
MRVIAGRFRSRKLKSVPGLNVRPTPDRLRESLFSIVAPQLEGATFLDAYAGSGSVGIEALSRGAERVILIERNAQALAVIRENLQTLGISAEVIVVRGNASAAIGQHSADITFIDPPYEHEKEYDNALLASSHAGCKLAIAQHPSRLTLEPVYGDLHKFRVVRQGDNSLSFYGREPSASE